MPAVVAVVKKPALLLDGSKYSCESSRVLVSDSGVLNEKTTGRRVRTEDLVELGTGETAAGFSGSGSLWGAEGVYVAPRMPCLGGKEIMHLLAQGTPGGIALEIIPQLPELLALDEVLRDFLRGTRERLGVVSVAPQQRRAGKNRSGRIGVFPAVEGT